MDISLINTGLAAGAALAALPVILHLFMRQTPKRVIFPALRLIRERQKRSKKKLRVKNWLLLLARMALLALMALALARPRIVSEASIGDGEVPTALGLVFDTSLSMSYKQPDKTRLDEAKERALDILKKTPSSSVVFVVDSAEAVAPPPLTPAAARKRIEALTIRTVNRSLNPAVGLAYAAVAETDKPRHEVYIFTDLARSAWDLEHPVEGLDKAASDKMGMKTYVLRLTPKDVRDVGVAEARPASDVVTEGEPVEVTAKLRSLGAAAKPVAELWIDGVVKDKKQVEVPASGEVEVRFLPQKVGGSTPVHQGYVRLSGSADPVGFDDNRYFTFTTRPATNVLVVSDVAIDGEWIANAIDPDPRALPPGTPRPFRVERALTSQFLEKATNLSKSYQCIFLNNVGGEELTEADWAKLSGFVFDGGGLVIGLGGHCQPESYQTAAAIQILPATVERRGDPLKEPTTFGQVTDYSHPLFSKYPKLLDEMLAQVPIKRYWPVQPHEGSRVLVAYADKSPALVERVFKGSRTGRVLLWTTPLSRRPDPNSPEAWNEFANPLSDNWSFYYLMVQSVAYLSGTTETSLVLEAGKDVVLPIDPSRRYKNYIVQDPEQKPFLRLSPPAGNDSLVIPAPQQLGNWSVKASGTEGNGEVIGFSVNPPVRETEFVSLETEDLNRLFKGKDRYALADDPDSLDKVIKYGRVGRELFPWLMLVIMMVVTIESVLANRFYRETGQQAAVRQGS
jgi:hypothetical protein